METKIIPAENAISSLYNILKGPSATESFKVWFCMLFGADRAACCDEAAIVEVDGEIAAIATISPRGEMDQDEPTIVGIYTLEKYRRQGYAKEVLIRAITRLAERGFDKVRIDALTKEALVLCGSLPDDIRSSLVVYDQSMCGDLLPA